VGQIGVNRFFRRVLHIVKQLPHDQGPNGRGVFLFLDWHSSRECPQSLLMSLLKHNVCMFVLPSKTSIWSQPCDNGKHELQAQAISKAAHDQGMLCGKPLDYADANKIFRAAMESNCLEQNDELRRTGSNAAVSSFKKTGLCPMDCNNEGWNNAFCTFGKLNELMKRQRKDAGERVPDATWIVKPRPIDSRIALTKEDTDAVRGFVVKDDFLLVGSTDGECEDADASMDIPLLLLAAAIAEPLLGVHLLNDQRDLSQSPQPKELQQVAPLKLVMFEGITVNDRVDTPCTLTVDETKRDKL